MNKTILFYLVKPNIPRKLQIALRREYVLILMKKYKDLWPILELAGSTPANWKSWPDNKKNAVVLIHDVETKIEHNKCEKLFNHKKDFRFRSSYNFVPERNNVSKNLRDSIVQNGFEIGGHNLKHDRKLLEDKQTVDKRAVKINSYIKESNTLGFHTPATQRN